MAAKGRSLVGSGVSGREEGARYGPSLIPAEARRPGTRYKPIWTAIAAKVDPKTGKPSRGAAPGKPVSAESVHRAHCLDGAGHYVKMVHNGIEYSDMQLISEASACCWECSSSTRPRSRRSSPIGIAGDLESFLIEITRDILRQKDRANPRRYLVDAVLDAGGPEGTQGSGPR